MPTKNSDRTASSVENESVENEILEGTCPKCGAEMEPIESAVEGLPLQQLQLCPGCYLVMWSDSDGLHVRQGTPVKEGGAPPAEPVQMDGEPIKC